MAVVTPSSGSVITLDSVTDMHLSVRTLMNNLQPVNLQRSALGPHHMGESILIDADLREQTSVETVDWDAGDQANAETIADVAATWKNLTGYTLNNSGAGYDLPPCKVVIWWDGRVGDFNEGAGDDNAQIWFALVYSIDGVEQRHVYNFGMIQSRGEFLLLDEPVCISDVIDQNAAGADWTLDYIRVYAAIGRGSSAAPVGGFVEILQGTTGLMAFLKDE